MIKISKYCVSINKTDTNPYTLVRKLPVIGIKNWLLIYDDTLLELAVKDAYDELEIVVI